MNSLEVTGTVVGVLEELQIPYMLVGAFSSNAYAIPRSTNDADFVVSIGSGDLRRIAQQLGADFRLDPQIRLETLTHSMRNVITHVPTRFDIELFRLSNDPHHQQRFERRVRKVIHELGREACLPTPEDVVIQKLRWQRRKDLDDAQNVLAVCFETLDWEYIRRWTDQHETSGVLDQLLAELPNLE